MDHFERLASQIRLRLIALGSIQLVFIALVLWAMLNNGFNPTSITITVCICLIISGVATAFAATYYALLPLKFVWQGIQHVSSENSTIPAPNIDQLKVGHELVHSLLTLVYQFASQQNDSELIEHRKELTQASNILNHLPLPVLVFNKDQVIVNASTAALEYCKLESSQLFGKPLFETINFEFASEHTLEKWITECQDQRVTDTAYWERVRVKVTDDQGVRQCDIAAYYNRDNASGTEFIVTLLDRTDKYNQEDASVNFVAIAVHELRTPLTMLRGYIEVFSEELGDKLDPEMTDFMHKMQLAAQQLTAFVNNILNVARIDENQLILHLAEENWKDIVVSAGEDMQQKAQLRGITIEYNIADELPTVGADRVSMYEVIYNLLDNAIKYSGKSKRIIVSSKLGQDGMVETSVQDFGDGIITSSLPHLFEKFYRNHRTKSQVGGTGLGLYLSKAIVTAHGGNIWVRSKEGEGSTFTFSLEPYSQLAEEKKTGNNTDIVRNAHGWIKNHSMYRR